MCLGRPFAVTRCRRLDVWNSACTQKCRKSNCLGSTRWNHIYIYIYIYIYRRGDVMRCKPPCVYFGAGRPDYTQGGERRGAKQRRRCATRTPTPPPVGGGRPSSGRWHIGPSNQQRQQGGHQAHTRTPTPTFRWGVRAQGGVCMDRANGTKLCMPELPRPHLSVGDVRATRQHAQWAKAEARSERGWGCCE